MKIILTNIYIFLTFYSIAQVDTIVWDYAKRQMVNQKYADGYHVFKKNGITVLEFMVIKGRNVGVTKEYYDNGNIKLESEYRHFQSSHHLVGQYKEYFESGKIKVQGTYNYSDSIPCINCFDIDESKVITKAYNHSERTGVWKEFHENGKVKARGNYKGIHQTNEINFPKNHTGTWTPGGYSEEYLKDKLWQYFDKNENLIREEFYFKGSLVDVKTYEHE